ncbi:MAG TPA: hypothetical protein PLN94_17470 [Thiolinea sp.]|nr:hypothetical protein [Thiolinea sp.]
MPLKKLHPEFLRHAEFILPVDSGRPQSVVIRRSISAAYYAVWHCVCFAWSQKFSPELQQMLSRSPDHKQVKTAAGKIKGNKSDWMTGDCCADLNQMCEDFIRLQEMRHEADYNITTIFQKQDAVEALSRAKRFIQTFETQNRDVTLGMDCLLLESIGLKKPSR